MDFMRQAVRRVSFILLAALGLVGLCGCFLIGALLLVRGDLVGGVVPPGAPSAAEGFLLLTLYLLGELPLHDMVVQLKSAIYQFARRQLTWCRRDTRIRWLDPERATEEAEVFARRALESADG